MARQSSAVLQARDSFQSPVPPKNPIITAKNVLSSVHSCKSFGMLPLDGANVLL